MDILLKNTAFCNLIIDHDLEQNSVYSAYSFEWEKFTILRQEMRSGMTLAYRVRSPVPHV